MSSNPPTSTTTDAEPGYLTTEFWGSTISSLITVAIAAYVAFGGQVTDAQKAAVLGAVGPVLAAIWGVYAIVRTIRKNATTKASANLAGIVTEVTKETPKLAP